MAKPMILKAGGTMKLPGGATWSGGIGWDGGADLDLWLLRRRAGIYQVDELMAEQARADAKS